MIDFGALPPEVNSARMYAGPGSGPMLAASAAWAVVGHQLGVTAAIYRSLLTDLTGGAWHGPTSLAMLDAAMPYVAWLNATAEHAERVSAQAGAAATAHDTAFAMTVPPPVIAANRAQLLVLVATNFFGQNTPAIAANEAHYAQMWAQDATAMYQYAASSEVASQITPPAASPDTTNLAGLAGQATAVGAAAETPPAVPPPAPPVLPPGLEMIGTGASFAVRNMTVGGDGIGMYTVWIGDNADTIHGALDALKGAKAGGAAAAIAGSVTPPAAATPATAGNVPVAAGLAKSARIGGLSVPSSFPGVSAVPSTAAPLPVGASPAGRPGIGGMPGIPGAPGVLLGGSGPQGMRFVPRYGYRHRFAPRPAGVG